VSVDLGLDNHPISPLIYGINFVDSAQIAVAKIPITRWGGTPNFLTTFNNKATPLLATIIKLTLTILPTITTLRTYLVRARIVLSLNFLACWGGTCPPADPLNDSAANQLLQQAIDNNMTTFLTVTRQPHFS
jgi:hypothetical protein